MGESAATGDALNLVTDAHAPTMPSPVPDMVRSLLFAASGPVEMLLTDDQGRRLGYDVITDTRYEAFPDALYYRDPHEPAAYSLIIGADPGHYTLTITGIGAGTYDVLGLYDDDTAVATLIADDGVIAPGQTLVFDLTVPATTGDVPMPPDVQAGPVITTEVNQSVTFTGSFIDLNPGDTHTVVWSFGDGATVTGTLTPTHTYRSAGVYTATLTVTDSSGFMVSDTVPVYVTMNPYPYPYPAP